MSCSAKILCSWLLSRIIPAKGLLATSGASLLFVLLCSLPAVSGPARNIPKQVKSLTQKEQEVIDISGTSSNSLIVREHIQGMAALSDRYWLATYDQKGKKSGKLELIDRNLGKIIDTFTMNFDGQGYPSGAQASGRYVAVTTGNDKRVRFFRVSNLSSSKPKLTELANLRLDPENIGDVENVGFARHPVNRHYYVLLTNSRTSELYVSRDRSIRTSNSNATSASPGWVRVSLDLDGGKIPFAEAGISLIFEEGSSDMYVFSLGAGFKTAGRRDPSTKQFASTLVEDKDNGFALTKLKQGDVNNPRSTVTVNKPQYLELRNGDGSFRWGGTAYTSSSGEISIVAAPRKELPIKTEGFGLWTAVLPRTSRQPSSTSGSSSGASRDYEVLIDCYYKGLDNTGTNDRITVQFWSGNQRVRSIYKDGVTSCSWNSSDPSWKISTKEPITHIVVKTDGADAFLIDELRILRNDVLVKKHDDDQGIGYCISKDSTDNTRTWKGKAAACLERRQFDL